MTYAYDGPVIGLDGYPVPCQTPGCSRRAATKSLCTRHRGLPAPTEVTAPDPIRARLDELEDDVPTVCEADWHRYRKLLAAVRAVADLAAEMAAKCPADDWGSGGIEDAVQADAGRAVLARLAALADPATRDQEAGS